MKPFLITFLLAAAYARPEPPVQQGYNYPSPGPISVDFVGPQLGPQLGPHQSDVDFGGLDTSFRGGPVGGHLDTTYGAPPQLPTVHKHVYVHVAPEEPQEIKPQRVIPTAAPQKHYKIIFIKAPNPPTPTAPIIPVQPQDEEKTLVYVLVKKPEEQPEIVVPTPAPTQPSKPEVYFIRYKTQKEGGSGGYNYGVPGGHGVGSGLGSSGVSGLGGAVVSGSGVSGSGISGAGGELSGPGAAIGGGSASTQYGPPGYHK
ncbi:uncharacterized protein [Euwallacea similis]|uniref:uncharacterized protein n=1 Tax=Euwallacea similis TaxID=1736056 RepID=UPI00344EA408